MSLKTPKETRTLIAVVDRQLKKLLIKKVRCRPEGPEPSLPIQFTWQSQSNTMKKKSRHRRSLPWGKESLQIRSFGSGKRPVSPSCGTSLLHKLFSRKGK